MPESDYLKFLRMQDILPPWLKLQSRQTDSDYPFDFIKLYRPEIPFERNALNGPKGVYMDIFPLVGSKRPSRAVLFCFSARTVMTYALEVKWNWTQKIPYKLWYARLMFNLLSLFPGKVILKLRDYMYRKIAQEGTDEYFSPGGSYKDEKEFFPKIWFEGTAELPFEAKLFPVPPCWELLLSRNYGANYMCLPSIEQQKSNHV